MCLFGGRKKKFPTPQVGHNFNLCFLNVPFWVQPLAHCYYRHLNANLLKKFPGMYMKVHHASFFLNNCHYLHISKRGHDTWVFFSPAKNVSIFSSKMWLPGLSKFSYIWWLFLRIFINNFSTLHATLNLLRLRYHTMAGTTLTQGKTRSYKSQLSEVMGGQTDLNF